MLIKRTVWRLFQKTVVRTKLDIYVVVYYHWVDTSAGGLLVPQCIIHPMESYYWNLQFLDNVIIIKTKVLSP